MLKRHEVQVPRRAGHTLMEVAALSGVSVGTVRRIEAEAAVETGDNGAGGNAPGRRQRLSHHREWL